MDPSTQAEPAEEQSPVPPIDFTGVIWAQFNRAARVPGIGELQKTYTCLSPHQPNLPPSPLHCPQRLTERWRLSGRVRRRPIVAVSLAEDLLRAGDPGPTEPLLLLYFGGGDHWAQR
ncbi:hypothetical protein NDU88_006045 [Pleurodeles waltl]|uniref:Uncharacterized protein n=1 Tax=Pleurodeles waltl TaxID=8319 RepID=A0AAV7QMV6_PLEWA|nr:hypothetical protein NDU88_006045 [Pleurodeles waltl]